MAEMARDAFSNRNYRLAAEMYERCLKERGPSFELYLGYGNSLAKCGQLREALDVFSHCCRLGTVPQDRLRYLSAALIDAVTAGAPAPQRTADHGFACPVCEGVLIAPVTTPCGHTFCRKCVVRDAGKTCRKCGQRLPAAALETNVLVKGLVEKWWGSELCAARIRDEGNELFQRSDVEGSLAKYNEAVAYVPDNHLLLSNRSHTLYRLNRLQAALTDADAVVKLRPNWGKGHFRRGVALSGLGRHEDALVELALCVALDRNPQAVKHEVTRALHCLLLGPSLRTRCHSLGVQVPLPAPYSLGPRLRRRFLASSHPALNSSDCEDNSSGEEDFSQVTAQRFSNVSATSLQENTKMHTLLDRIFMEVDRLKRGESRVVDLMVCPEDVDVADFECVLCCRTLWRPVTTPCGHTYCWMCLDRCLDYSFACPLCMTSLADYLTTSQKSITEFVEHALRVLLPTEYAARQMQHYQELSVQDREPSVPVFVCTTAFPGVPCPLYVYEPRYRVMVRRCIEAGTKQFGIAACLNKDAGLKRYAEFGTLLEIRDWVLLGDGSSILTAVGARRFRVLVRDERDGYDTAQVEFIRDQVVPPEHLHKMRELHERVRHKGWLWFSSMPAAVQAEIVRTFGHMPAVEEDWVELADGPAWPWWLLAILPLGQHLQAGILGTTSLEKRLRAIDKTLDQIQLWTGSVSQVSSRREHTPSSQSLQQASSSSQQTTGRSQAAVRAS